VLDRIELFIWLTYVFPFENGKGAVSIPEEVFLLISGAEIRAFKKIWLKRIFFWPVFGGWLCVRSLALPPCASGAPLLFSLKTLYYGLFKKMLKK